MVLTRIPVEKKNLYQNFLLYVKFFLLALYGMESMKLMF